MFAHDPEPVAGPRRPPELIARRDVAVGIVVLVLPTHDRRASHRRAPFPGVVTEQPGGHVTAIRPTGDGGPGPVDIRFQSQLSDAGHDVPPRTRPPVPLDRGHVGVPQVVAAAVVGHEHDPALCGHELRQIREVGLGCRRRAAVDVEDQRIAPRRVEVRRINHDPIRFEAILRPPRDPLQTSEPDIVRPVVELRQLPRFRLRGVEDVQLGGLIRACGHEGDPTARARLDLVSETAADHEVTQFETRRRSFERLHPDAHRGAVIRGHEQRAAIGLPLAVEDISIEGPRQAASFPARGGHDMDLVLPVDVPSAIARGKIADPATVRRPRRVTLESGDAGERTDVACRDVQYRETHRVETATLRRRHSSERDARPLRRPRQLGRRAPRRQRELDRPRARGEPLGVTVQHLQPDVLRSDSTSQEEVLVLDLKCPDVACFTRPRRQRVLGCIGDRTAIGTPREVLHTRLRTGRAARFAATHG